MCRVAQSRNEYSTSQWCVADSFNILAVYGSAVSLVALWHTHSLACLVGTQHTDSTHWKTYISILNSHFNTTATRERRREQRVADILHAHRWVRAYSSRNKNEMPQTAENLLYVYIRGLLSNGSLSRYARILFGRLLFFLLLILRRCLFLQNQFNEYDTYTNEMKCSSFFCVSNLLQKKPKNENNQMAAISREECKTKMAAKLTTGKQ